MIVKKFFEGLQLKVNQLEIRFGQKTAYFHGLVANILYAIVDYEIRNSAEVPTFQLMLYRSTFSLILNYAYCSLAKLPLCYKSSSINRMLFVRAFLWFLSFFLTYYGFQRADLSEAIALFQVVPVMTILLGILILRESCNLVESIVTLFSIIGALMIIKPPFLSKFEENQEVHSTQTKYVGNLCVIGAAVTHALTMVLVKKMAVQKIDPQINTYYVSALMCIISPVGILFQGMIKLDDEMTKNVILLCVFGFGASYLNFRALQFGDAGKVALMSYAEIPFGYILDIFLFGSHLDDLSFWGALIIFSCLFIQIFKEHFLNIIKSIRSK